jgi:hypothetical protein
MNNTACSAEDSMIALLQYPLTRVDIKSLLGVRLISRISSKSSLSDVSIVPTVYGQRLIQSERNVHRKAGIWISPVLNALARRGLRDTSCLFNRNKPCSIHCDAMIAIITRESTLVVVE